MKTTLTTIALLTILSCSKEETIKKVDNTPITVIEQRNYSNSEVYDLIIGNWEITKKTNVGNDTICQEIISIPLDVIYIAGMDINLNNGLWEQYDYNDYTIQSLNHHYYVDSISLDSNEMYVKVFNQPLMNGFNELYYSLNRQ